MWNMLCVDKIPSNLTSKLNTIKKINEEINLCYTKDELQHIYAEYDYLHVYNSLRTEGSTLTLDEVKSISSDETPILIDDKQYMECYNLYQALIYTKHMASIATTLTEQFILELHRILSTHLLNDTTAGHYRTVRNMIGNGNYETAQINQVPKLMKQLVNISNSIDNPIVRAAWTSYNLVSIHPFVDYNGRLSRLLEIFTMMSSGYQMIYLPQDKVSEYLSIIQNGQIQSRTTNVEYIDFISNLLTKSLQHVRNS